MKNNKEYIEAIANLIIETEVKLQEAIKNNGYGNKTENLKTVLKYLRKKQKELSEDQNKKKKI